MTATQRAGWLIIVAGARYAARDLHPIGGAAMTRGRVRTPPPGVVTWWCSLKNTPEHHGKIFRAPKVEALAAAGIFFGRTSDRIVMLRLFP